jgi:ribosomal protein S27AE
MNLPFECGRCHDEFAGRRLRIEQNATDDTGLQTVVEKRWTLCPECAETVMSQVGEVSPWSQDGRTVILPDAYDEPQLRLHALTR